MWEGEDDGRWRGKKSMHLTPNIRRKVVAKTG